MFHRRNAQYLVLLLRSRLVRSSCCTVVETTAATAATPATAADAASVTAATTTTVDSSVGGVAATGVAAAAAAGKSYASRSGRQRPLGIALPKATRPVSPSNRPPSPRAADLVVGVRQGQVSYADRPSLGGAFRPVRGTTSYGEGAVSLQTLSLSLSLFLSPSLNAC